MSQFWIRHNRLGTIIVVIVEVEPPPLVILILSLAMHTWAQLRNVRHILVVSMLCCTIV